MAGVVGVKGSSCQCGRPGKPIGTSPQPPARTHFSYSFLHLLRFISWNVSGVAREGIPNRILQFPTFPPTLWVDTEDLIVKSPHVENPSHGFPACSLKQSTSAGAGGLIWLSESSCFPIEDGRVKGGLLLGKGVSYRVGSVGGLLLDHIHGRKSHHPNQPVA